MLHMILFFHYYDFVLPLLCFCASLICYVYFLYFDDSLYEVLQITLQYLIMRKLEQGEARQSLDRLFFGENTYRKNNGNEEPKQDINKLDQLKKDGPRISVNASESLHDRNSEVVKKKEISSKCGCHRLWSRPSSQQAQCN